MAHAFPDGFRWGTATAAHQVEGGNWNSDWWEWEHAPGTICREPSGDACDQWHRYPEDIALLADLGFDNYRFSIEWARIEPEEGEFSLAALEHYKRVAATCLEHGVQPVITLHHFTSPRWLTRLGGWTDRGTVDRFCRYAERAARYLDGFVGRVCTINEPNIVAFCGYMLAAFPPAVTDKVRYRQAQEVFRDAHVAAVPVLRGVLGDDVPVGLTLAMTDYQASDPDDPDAVAMRDRYRRVSEDHYLEACRTDDFIGVQCYTREVVGPDGPLRGRVPTGAPTGDDGDGRLHPDIPILPMMGYEYYPEALEACVRRAWDVTGNIPVLVTENGIGTDDDGQRIAYVRTALEGVLRCIEDGIEVQGYTYWSLLDNFEWAFGYEPTFGLVAVDRRTFVRTPHPSAQWLGAIARANALP